jgi:predicted Rossmann-fold nucleotide-binding protein
MGSDFWTPLVQWLHDALLVGHQSISADDLRIWTLTDDVEETLHLIEQGVNEQVQQHMAATGRTVKTADDKLRQATADMSGTEQ